MGRFNPEVNAASAFGLLYVLPRHFQPCLSKRLRTSLLVQPILRNPRGHQRESAPHERLHTTIPLDQRTRQRRTRQTRHRNDGKTYPCRRTRWGRGFRCPRRRSRRWRRRRGGCRARPRRPRCRGARGMGRRRPRGC